MATLNGYEGVWRTIGGRHIFIENGDDLPTAMRKSGKFGKEYKGHLEENDSGDVYYQLDNGDKIEFLDKKEYKKMIDDFYDSLSDDEKEALYIWIDDPAYMGYNPMYKYEKDYNKIMDDIFENKAVILDKDVLLFRRASDDYLDLSNGVNKKYALSTSAYDKIPKTMPSGKKFGDKELYIIAPKGTKILPIEKVAVNHPSNIDGESKIYARQHEIVLPKKTGYEIVEDLSTYYYRPPKYNEFSDVETTDQKYVVKLTNKNYDKVNYSKPEYREYWNRNGYERYIYNHNGKKISIEEKYVGDRSEKRLKKSRKDVVKYRVSDLVFVGQEEYYDTYEEAIEKIKKYL